MIMCMYIERRRVIWSEKNEKYIKKHKKKCTFSELLKILQICSNIIKIIKTNLILLLNLF